MKKTRKPAMPTIAVLYTVYYPKSKLFLSCVEEDGTTEIACFRRPARADAAAIRATAENPDDCPADYVIVKFIPAAVMEREYHQRSVTTISGAKREDG